MVLAKQHHLSERQKLAVEHITKQGSLSIQEFEKYCPGVTRRTLQRELKALIEKKIIKSSGETNNLVYQLKTKWSFQAKTTKNTTQRAYNA